ncbi:MAG: hypothetical protein ABI384_04385 [Allobranchiibius sp.]
MTDLTAGDRAAIAAVAQRYGIADWVRVECVDPEHLRMWESLRKDLICLQREQDQIFYSRPTPGPRVSSGPVIDADRTLADPVQLRIELVDPVAVRTGFFEIFDVSLTDLTATAVDIETNGNLTGVIVDRNGVGVGSCFGMQISPLVVFSAVPEKSVQIPIWVGTDSCSPDLGYALPAGDWHVVAALDLTDGRRLISPPCH